MEKTHWTSSEIQKLFRLDERIKSRQTLFNAEERGEIPKAARIPRGKQQIRQWSLDQIPKIGLRFGFLQKPKEPQVLCVYTAKGGVLNNFPAEFSLKTDFGCWREMNGVPDFLCIF